MIFITYQEKNEFSSYNFLKKSEIILSLSSSLGYEFLSRDNRMIFFQDKLARKPLRFQIIFIWMALCKKKERFFIQTKLLQVNSQG